MGPRFGLRHPARARRGAVRIRLQVGSRRRGRLQVYRVSVPLSSGPVVIDATARDRKDVHGWSGGAFTSFPKEQATLIHSATRGWSVDPLAGTEASVTHRLLRPGDGDKPLSNGDADGGAVTVRFLVHLPRPDGEFGNLAGEPWQRRVRVPLTGETEWKWAEHLLREMTLYEIRQVRLPARIGGPAAHWLPGYDEISVEMRPIAIERK